MRYYVDCEFIEDGSTIDLISIGIVADDGREYYAVSTEFNPRKASDWVLENILLPMGINRSGWIATPDLLSPQQREHWKAQRNRDQIKQEILSFAKQPCLDHLQKIEFWGEWCSYDHVALCQLFGTMMDLPEGFPMRTCDIIQWAENHLGISADNLPVSLETEGNHNALLGAHSVKQRWEFLKAIEAQTTVK